VSPQQSYGQISADSQVLCGNLVQVRGAAKRFTSPVYSYIAVHIPESVPCILGLSGYACPSFAFHISDLMQMYDQFGPLWVLSDDDVQFGLNLKNAFIDFATSSNGTITVDPNWIPAQQSPGYPAQIWSTLVDSTMNGTVNYHEAQCAFWAENGFERFWWPN